MSKTLIYISLLAFSLLAACSKDPWTTYSVPADLLDEKLRTDTTIVKILSFGTLHVNASLPRFAAIVDSLDADFVLAREIDHDNTRSGKGVKQGERIAVLSGMKHYFGGSQAYNGGFYGMSILSKYDIVDSSKVLFTGNRPVANISVLDAKGRKFTFIGAQFTDVSTTAAAATRVEHAALLLNISKNFQNPTIMAGCFWVLNPFEDATLDVLADQFTSGCYNCDFTHFPTNAAPVVADQVLYKKSRRYEVKVVKYEVLPNSPTDRKIVYSELMIIQ